MDVKDDMHIDVRVVEVCDFKSEVIEAVERPPWLQGPFKSKRLYYREPFLILSVLAQRDWRFSVVEGDTMGISL